MSVSGVLGWLQKPFGESERAAQTRLQAAGDAAAAAQPADQSKTFLTWLGRVAAGIIAGLGLAGVMSLIGAGVLWLRFREAGLPTTQALDVVPEGQLIIQGAAATITALALGSLAVLILFSIDRTGLVTRGSAIALALLWLGGTGYAIIGTRLSWGAVLLIALLGLVLIGASIGIGKVTGNRFVPFAAAVFVSAGLVGAAISLAIAAQQNYIQPAAVLRSPEGHGIKGFYVADDADYIYIGVIREGFIPTGPGDAVPVYRIPREDETRLLIGKLQTFEAAVNEAEELRGQLKETEQFDDPLPPVDPATGAVTSDSPPTDDSSSPTNDSVPSGD
jgi:hypothetical protein